MAPRGAYRRRPASAARVPEKAEQAHGVQLVRSIGGTAYVLGGHRRRTDHQGTMQTPGIPDVMFFLPPPPSVFTPPHTLRLFLFWECKAAGGTLRPEQRLFEQLCQDAKISHLVGPFDALILWLAQNGYVTADSFPHYRQPSASLEACTSDAERG